MFDCVCVLLKYRVSVVIFIELGLCEGFVSVLD